MRSSAAGFFTPPSTSYSSSPAPSATSTTATHSAWHSPVPYLFGGLAAMLGLIAFALLILACSYWKLSGYLDSAEESAGDIEAASTAKAADVTAVKPTSCCEQGVAVIMPGDPNPTCLAIPIACRASSFGDDGSCSCDGPKRSAGGGDGDGDGKEAESFNAKEERRSSENDQSSQEQYQ